MSVCLSRTSGLRREQKGLGRLKLAHVTFKVKRSKVKGQGHQAALLTAAVTREAGAAVTVRTYWAWETTAALRLLGGARGALAPTGRRGAGAYRVATRTACFTPSWSRIRKIREKNRPIFFCLPPEAQPVALIPGKGGRAGSPKFGVEGTLISMCSQTFCLLCALCIRIVIQCHSCLFTYTLSN